MKGKEFFDEKLFNEDDCEVCYFHEQADNKINGLECPYCHKIINNIEDLQHEEIIGETNNCDIEVLKEENFLRIPVFDCPHCHETIGLYPIPISNSNSHDVYYTGGKEYLPEIDFNKLINESDIENLIKNYTNRIQNGENLTSWNLKTWLEYEIEHIIAKVLFDKGLKK